MITLGKTLILFCLMIFVPTGFAQQGAPAADYIIQGESIGEFQWLLDGTSLRVIDETTSVEQQKDFEYDLTSQTSQPSSELLSAQQLDQLGILETESTAGTRASSIVYLSPDKQWAVYGVTEKEQHYLAISNLISRQDYVIHDAPMLVIDQAHLFKARWSNDSSALYVYSSDGPNVYWYYISHFTKALKNTSVIRLNERQGSVKGAIGPVVEVFDIAAQGEILLLETIVRTESPTSIGSQLVALNMKSSTYDILIEQTQSIVGASFGKNDVVYYIDLQGMYIYNVKDKSSQLINTDINASWVGDVEISPDGRYVAAIEGGNDHALYIIGTGLE